jgi:hypothetical protein
MAGSLTATFRSVRYRARSSSMVKSGCSPSHRRRSSSPAGSTLRARLPPRGNGATEPNVLARIQILRTQLSVTANRSATS